MQSTCHLRLRVKTTDWTVPSTVGYPKVFVIFLSCKLKRGEELKDLDKVRIPPSSNLYTIRTSDNTTSSLLADTEKSMIRIPRASSSNCEVSSEQVINAHN